MKILFLTDNFPPETNAAASRVYERARYWAQWGHEVTILTSAPNKPQGKVYPGYQNHWRHVSEMDGMRVVRVKTFVAANEGAVLRILDFLSYMVSATVFGLFEKRPDVVAATSPQFFTGVSGWILSKFFRVPYVFEIADLWPAGIAAVGAIRSHGIIGLLEQLELFLYRQAKRVVTLTEAFRQDLIRRHIPEDKIATILNGVEMHAFFPKPPDQTLIQELELNGKYVVGYIGTLGSAHGLESMLKAAALLNNKSRVQFLFVGDGAEKQKLLQMKKDLHLKNVTFVDQKPKNEMLRYWSICDTALVSLRAGPILATVIPSKIFEAMACGKPVAMMGPDGEGSKIVRESGCGFVVNAESPEAFAEQVHKLSEDSTAHKNLATASLKAAEKYSRKVQAEKMLAALTFSEVS